MTYWIKNTQDGDAHRAATGGATVVLRPRRWQQRDGIRDELDADVASDGSSAPVRISQYNHSEVMETRKFCNSSGVVDSDSVGDNPLARKVARGGLLCDDPGLGTYTMQ